MTQEALKLALEALLHAHHEDEAHPRTLEAITAIKEALAQEQEPVAKYSDIVSNGGLDPRNTTPPQRSESSGKPSAWVGLTDDEIAHGWKESWVTEQAFQSAVWWAEEKLKEKNT